MYDTRRSNVNFELLLTKMSLVIFLHMIPKGHT